MEEHSLQNHDINIYKIKCAIREILDPCELHSPNEK